MQISSALAGDGSFHRAREREPVLPPHLSIVVATRNRGTSLQAMLPTLAAAAALVSEPVEVIVVDNGSTDSTPRILEEWCRSRPGWSALTVSTPGKSRALNRAVGVARGSLLAFTDDDVEVPQGWAVHLTRFFAAHPEYAAATGPITLPPAVTDPTLMRRVEMYRTLPLFDQGSELHDTAHLYGCNMALRRSTFDRVGRFDERLGPGASGLHEDGDLAERIRSAGLRIAYVPEMEMHHTAEPSRLSWEFFIYLHQADARSRFVQRGGRGRLHAARHLLGAAAVWLWWGMVGNRRRRMRARGRIVSYRELLRLNRA